MTLYSLKFTDEKFIAKFYNGQQPAFEAELSAEQIVTYKQFKTAVLKITGHLFSEWCCEHGDAAWARSQWNDIVAVALGRGRAEGSK